MGKNKTLEAIISIAGQLDPSLARTISNVQEQISGVQEQVGNTQKHFSGLKVSIAAISTVTAAATAAVVKFGIDAAKSAAAFETQMANVSTLLDGEAEAVAERIGELGDDVLAVSNKTGVGTDELTDGLYQIISAVGDSEDAIAQMELAAKAAAAGGATTTDAINLLTAVTKGYGDTSGEAFQKASDLSFMTVKLGQTSFPELASSMGKVVPLASALGVEQEELYGAFATLTGVTGSTAEVSTQMKAVMSGLMSPTDGMTKALKSLGYANVNAALESLGLQGTLDALGSTVNGDTQALAKMFSSVEAQTAILALSGSQAENFTEKTAAMYEATGATEAAFAKQADTLEYTIQSIKNLGKNFMTSIGRTILPIVKDIAQKLLPVVQTGLEHIQPIIENLYAALTPVIDVAGDFILGLMPGFEGKLNTMCGLWERMQPVLGELSEQYLPVFQNVLGKVGGLFETIAPSVSQFVDSLLPVMAQLLSTLAPIIGTVVDSLSPAFDMIGSLVSSMLPALAELIGFLADVFQAAAPLISQRIAEVLDTVVAIVGNIIGVFTGLCDFITGAFTGNWEAAWNGVVSALANIIKGIARVAMAFISPVVDIINAVITGINGIVIPDWVPGVGGKSLNIPTIQLPEFAEGGFTEGVSIAGEAGTEAVISFASAHRDENIGYWSEAGQMLGVDMRMLEVATAVASVFNDRLAADIPFYASGGFTQGLSFAGEAGTEAIISFDRAYRNENLSYWAQAGQMLGVDDSMLNAFESGASNQENFTFNITFSPQITINSTERLEFDLMEKLREEEENLMDMLEDMLERRGGDQYRASFG